MVKFIEVYKPSKEDTYAINNWSKYELTQTQDDFIVLMINLYIHNETLEEFIEGIAQCGYYSPTNRYDIIKAVIDDTCIFNNYNEFIKNAEMNYKEDPDFYNNYNFDEYLKEFELENNDNYFINYQGKIYKRVFY